MQYRKMNKHDKNLSLLGFGTMRFPTKDGEIDKEETFKMLDYALANGVTYYDTAWFYHNYKSEGVLGEWLGTVNREELTVIDKLPLWECKTLEEAKELFYKQLEKVGVDYFDFYLCHALSSKRWNRFKELDVMPFLEQMKAEGKIRHIGFSFHAELEDFEYIVDDYPWEVALIQLNYMDVDYQQGFRGYELLTERNIDAIIMEPLKGGKLAKFAPDIEQIFKDYNPDVSIASWSLRWLASLDNVKVVLSGMSTYDQVDDNLKTMSTFEKMNDEELALIQKVQDEVKSRSKIECTGCDYCMPCPFEVNIPKNFSIINNHAMYLDDREAKGGYKSLIRKEADASKCTDCGVCIEKCPQNLDIPNLMKDVEAHIKELEVK